MFINVAGRTFSFGAKRPTARRASLIRAGLLEHEPHRLLLELSGVLLTYRSLRVLPGSSKI
jgi:hypothetical protein